MRTAGRQGRTTGARARACAILALVGGCGGAGAAGGGQSLDAATSGGSLDAGAPGDGAGSAPVDVADALTPEAGAAHGTSASLRFIGDAYTLYASVGGGSPHVVQLDTGSIGLYVPASILGPGAQVSTTETCSITYVSSGNTLSGHAATATVALLGSTRSGDVSPAPTTVPMPLCAVDDAAFKGGMMGVGFGRGATPDPARNVLLRLADVASGAMHAGYILSAHPSPSVRVGLTAEAVAGFATLPLTPHPAVPGDWLSTSLRGCLTLPGHGAFAEACGPLLVDTGIADCLLWGPSDPTLGGVIPAGQTAVPGGVSLRIAAPSGGATLDYAFVVGAGSDSPAAVKVRTAAAFSINTGRALLIDDDYLFDAVAGRVGFRRASP